MAFTLELEEWVGSVWHRFITRRASVDFPEARVELVPGNARCRCCFAPPAVRLTWGGSGQ